MTKYQGRVIFAIEIVGQKLLKGGVVYECFVITRKREQNLIINQNYLL